MLIKKILKKIDKIIFGGKLISFIREKILRSQTIEGVRDLSNIRWKIEITEDEWNHYIIYLLKTNLDKENFVIFSYDSASTDFITMFQNFLTEYPEHRVILADSKNDQLGFETLSEEVINQLNETNSVIFSFSPYNLDVSNALSKIMNHSVLRNISYFYKINPAKTYPALLNYDKRFGEIFISPTFENNEINKIYLDSLQLFLQKCDVRDTYDFYQMLKQVKNVPGDVIEFGSFQGHSGWIISKVVEAMNGNKQVYLCDTFENFPVEELGVDQFWSNTHAVNYEEVKSKFTDLEFVNFVKGDFFETVPKLNADLFSFVYIDCDSYRGVKFIAESIYPKLSSGGVMIFEDYGHAFCLGARYATDEFIASLDDCYTFFSGFSGFLIVIKK
jgi:hypothetical protein